MAFKIVANDELKKEGVAATGEILEIGAEYVFNTKLITDQEGKMPPEDGKIEITPLDENTLRVRWGRNGDLFRKSSESEGFLERIRPQWEEPQERVIEDVGEVGFDNFYRGNPIIKGKTLIHY